MATAVAMAVAVAAVVAATTATTTMVVAVAGGVVVAAGAGVSYEKRCSPGSLISTSTCARGVGCWWT